MYNKNILGKVIIYSIFIIFIISALWNAYYTIISYISSNLTIRESYTFTNDVNKKGTHWGAKQYFSRHRENKISLIKFEYASIIKAFKNIHKILPVGSNYINETKLISLLLNLSKNNNKYKKESAIYIPKTLVTYWNLSCDSHMPPFVAPAVTNYAMIEGLPSRELTTSCYTHFNDYGYSTYKLMGLEAKYSEMDRNAICENANAKGFKTIIQIIRNMKDEFDTLYHYCGANYEENNEN